MKTNDEGKGKGRQLLFHGHKHIQKALKSILHAIDDYAAPRLDLDFLMMKGPWSWTDFTYRNVTKYATRETYRCLNLKFTISSWFMDLAARYKHSVRLPEVLFLYSEFVLTVYRKEAGNQWSRDDFEYLSAPVRMLKSLTVYKLVVSLIGEYAHRNIVWWAIFWRLC